MKRLFIRYFDWWHQHLTWVDRQWAMLIGVLLVFVSRAAHDFLPVWTALPILIIYMVLYLSLFIGLRDRPTKD